MTYKNRSPLLAVYTATQNIVPQVEHEIKVSIQIFVVRTLGCITLGQSPPSLMVILAAREIHYITPLRSIVTIYRSVSTKPFFLTYVRPDTDVRKKILAIVTCGRSHPSEKRDGVEIDSVDTGLK